MSNATVLIPIRAVHGGKTRLAHRFDEDTRARLVVRMASHVLSTVVASEVASRIVVVTQDPALAAAFDHVPGIDYLVQPRKVPGLNGAIGFGRDATLALDSRQLIVLSADLPILTVPDLLAIDRGRAAVTIVSDRRGDGTNALQLRGSDTIRRFEFNFGSGSAQAHAAAAEAIGARAETLVLPGAGLDIDTVPDWEALPGAVRAQLLDDWQTKPYLFTPELMLMEQS